MKAPVFSGVFEMSCTTPPIASVPYKTDAGPFSTSICLISVVSIKANDAEPAEPVFKRTPSRSTKV
ncbi:hypothetical protein D3C75_1047670 [compost metagenome]